MVDGEIGGNAHEDEFSRTRRVLAEIAAHRARQREARGAAGLGPRPPEEILHGIRVIAAVVADRAEPLLPGLLQALAVVLVEYMERRPA